MRRPSGIVAIAALVLTACAGESGGQPGSSHGASVSVAGERPTTEATVRILSPDDGEVVRGDVEVAIELEGAEIASQTTTDLRPDEGHIHVLVDDELVSMTEGLTQTLPDLEPGTHLLKIEFVANDHAPFEPRVIDAVAFEVRTP